MFIPGDRVKKSALTKDAEWFTQTSKSGKSSSTTVVYPDKTTGLPRQVKF